MNAWVPWAAKGVADTFITGMASLLINPFVDIAEKGCGRLVSMWLSKN